ncbi:hypothetical protein [Synechococcus sp. MIT S1220]
MVRLIIDKGFLFCYAIACLARRGLWNEGCAINRNIDRSLIQSDR